MSLSHPTKVDEPNNSEIDGDKEIVWVTRLRQNTNAPPTDMTPFMPNGHITVNLEHKKNFSIKAREILREPKSGADMHDIAEDTTFQDRELVPGVHRLLRRLELEDMAKAFLDSVPDVVQSSVYVDALTHRDSDEAGGVYVGFSVAYKDYIGIAGRIALHQRFLLRYRGSPRSIVYKT
jgi:hypothetical protein